MRKVETECSPTGRGQSASETSLASNLKVQTCSQKQMEESEATPRNFDDRELEDLVSGVHAAQRLVENVKRDLTPEITSVLIFRLIHQIPRKTTPNGAETDKKDNVAAGETA